MIQFFALAGSAKAANKQIDVTIGWDPAPTPVSFAVGDNTPKSTGALTIDPTKQAHKDEAGESSPTYTWSVAQIDLWNPTTVPPKYEAMSDTSGCHITISSATEKHPQLTAWFEVAGKYRVWIRGGMSYTWQGDTYSGTTDGVINGKNDDISRELTAVGIEKIVVSGVTPEDAGPTTVLKGSTITLLAKVAPGGATYPSGKPVWTIESQPSGSTLSNPSSLATATFSPLVNGEYTVKATCGSSSDTFIFYYTDVKIRSLTFDVVSGGSIYGIDTDFGAGYPTSHWYDANVNGKTSESGDRRSPVAYKRGSTMKVDAEFKLATGVSPSGAIKIKGTGPGNLEFDTDVPAGQPTVTSGSESVSISGLKCKNAMAETVDFFGADGYLDIAWQVSLDGGTTWAAAGTTHNQVYVLFDDPISGTSMRHTLIHIGCKAAKGSDNWSDITMAIWGVFASRSVKNVDGTPLKYYGNYAIDAFETIDLLEKLDGQCGAWARMFLDVRKVQGITETGHLVRVECIEDEQFLVKNWGANAGTSGNNPYTKLLVPRNPDSDDALYDTYIAEFFNQPGIAGQSQADPKANFSNHALVYIDGVYFDPSYGLLYFSVDDPEDIADFRSGIAGFYIFDERHVSEAFYNVDLNGDNDKTDNPEKDVVLGMRDDDKCVEAFSVAYSNY